MNLQMNLGEIKVQNMCVEYSFCAKKVHFLVMNNFKGFGEGEKEKMNLFLKLYGKKMQINKNFID